MYLERDEVYRIYNSDNFCEIVSDYVAIDEKQILDEIKSSISELTKHCRFVSPRYLSPYWLLYLTDNRGIIRYEIGYQYKFHVEKVFIAYVSRYGQDIIDLMPIPSAHIKVCRGRVYFDNEKCVFELCLWSLVALLKIKKSNEFLRFSENGDTHFRDSCVISTDPKCDNWDGTWYFQDLSAQIENEDIIFSGFGENNYFRLKYNEVKYKAILNLSNGKLEFRYLDYDSYDYK